MLRPASHGASRKHRWQLATRTEWSVDATPGTFTATDLRDLTGAALGDLVRSETPGSVSFRFSGEDNACGGRSPTSSTAFACSFRSMACVPDEFLLGGSEPTGRHHFVLQLYRRLEILQGYAFTLTAATRYLHHQVPRGLRAAHTATLRLRRRPLRIEAA